MATMNSVIEYVDRQKPNAYTDEDKFNWISRVESMIGLEVHGDAEPKQLLSEDADKQLSVPHPFDDLYALYVMSMIDFNNREYSNYNNTATMFSEQLDAYRAYYIQRNAHGKARNFRNVMG